jgi:hypothetical protein
MADERVEIEIVLDDGSIQKGFTKVQKQGKKTANRLESNLGGSFKRLGALVAGLAAGIGAAIGSREAVRAAVEQEQAIRNLNIALSNAGSFSIEASDNIQRFATELQRTTRFGDEAILQQFALARNFARSNEEAQALVAAAVDLSDATGLTLDSAVRNLGKTFSGLQGELGESLPALRALTQEQLKSGEAVRLVSELFGGTAQQSVQTFGGRIQQLSNNFGDLLESIGEFITKTPIFADILGKITSLLGNAADALRDFTRDPEGLANLNNGVVEFGVNIARFVIAPLELATNAGKIFVNGLAAGFTLITQVAASVFQGVAETVLSTVDTVLKGLQRVALATGDIGRDIAFSLGRARTGLDELGKGAVSVAETVGVQSAEIFQSTTEGVRSSISDIFNFDVAAASSQFIEGFRITSETIEQQQKEAADRLKNNAKQTVQEVVKESQGINKAFQQGLVRVISVGAQAIGRSLNQGSSAFKDFGKAVLGIIGDIAIQIGQTLIAIGLGIDALKTSLATLTGGFALAAGLALVALGGLLKSLGGGGLSVGGAAAGGGGVATEGVGQLGAPADVAEEAEGESTQVQIDVSGQVLDPLTVGNQIAQVLNDAFEAGGTRVVTT